MQAVRRLYYYSGNYLHHSKTYGTIILGNAKATIEDNIITDNDCAGISIDHSTAILNGNTIKDNGRCKIVRAEEELAVWHPTRAAVYRSPDGFPGVRVENLSSITMPPYSNAIDGNGKVGSWEQAVTIDEASYRYCA